ncbi:MAG TPA: polyprenyl diphosphate synthase [Candidatus Nanopelagicaceae bacterium]|nr:polyprenyl diphosphate synthase [Candidatus Nanopelagicaceae bacterium]
MSATLAKAHSALPAHIGIIMDGNGRWARQRGLRRSAGHRAGIRAIRQVMAAADQAGVHCLTLYAFSTENWSRPRYEVATLMRLFEETLQEEVDELHRNGVRIRVIGRREQLSSRLRRLVAEAESVTAENQSGVLSVAINYGGRAEIVDAVKSLARQGVDLSQVDELALNGALYTAGLPDPDLIIRTAGEMRTSNFLIWQAAYAELYVTQTLWPDFAAADLRAALADYAARVRRFGGIPEQG